MGVVDRRRGSVSWLGIVDSQVLKRHASDGVRCRFQGGGVTRVIPPARRAVGRRWNGITPPGFSTGAAALGFGLAVLA